MRARWLPVPCAVAVAVVAAAAPAHALSRYDDGDVALSTVDGVPCFAVERYLGPISLFWTRKFRPVDGRFTVYSASVSSRQPPHALMWAIDAPERTAGWALDRGQCIALGARPRGVQTVIGERGLPLPPGTYEVMLRVRDLHRGGGGRLTALFCIDDDGRMLAGSKDAGAMRCGAMVAADDRILAPAPLLEAP